MGLMITYTILVVPYYEYSLMGPQNPILIVKAPTNDFGRQIYVRKGYSPKPKTPMPPPSPNHKLSHRRRTLP